MLFITAFDYTSYKESARTRGLEGARGAREKSTWTS